MKIGKEISPDELRETAEMPMSLKISIAMRAAMKEVIQDYRRTGNLLVIWRDGKIYRQSPDEAQRELDQADPIVWEK